MFKIILDGIIMSLHIKIPKHYTAHMVESFYDIMKIDLTAPFDLNRELCKKTTFIVHWIALKILEAYCASRWDANSYPKKDLVAFNT